jgi:hypothetical protein
LEIAIPKKADDGKTKRSRLLSGEPAPPPLSEELIAQLQGAVSAAQRKKSAHSRQPRDPSDPNLP